MNFNDLTLSMLTLFTLIIVNNWFVIVDMYADVSGNNIVRVYFIVFYYFGVMVGINIVIAFAIDMFGAVTRMSEDYEKDMDVLVDKAMNRRTEEDIRVEKKE
jgi:hypothetical protein